MTILEGIDGLKRLPAGAVVSIGNFDGIHLGHRQILRTAADLRRAANAPALAVVTFEPHPLTVLRPEAAPPRLTPPALKRELLASAGASHLVVLPPEPAVLGMTAEQFWATLRDDVRPSHLVEGRSFTFGKGRAGTVDRLREWSAPTAVRLHVVDPVSVPLLDLSVVPVSSSVIRWLLLHGRARDAAVCLGRPYALEGQIIKGHQRGRAIGVPTANLDCGDQLVPCEGVYAARCDVDGRTCPAALSIGTMPTFGANAPQVEAHLIGYDGDLYGRTLRVEVLEWLREQREYRGIDALKAAIARDLGEVSARAALDASRPIVSAT